MGHRIVLFLSTLLVLIAAQIQAATKPNIVYILADDMGVGDVSALNEHSKIPTPNIDRLAAGGKIFTDAHSGSGVCTPTRYGLLTGRYSWRTELQKGVTWGFSPNLIDPKRMTVASLLRENGYITACVGKWHLGMDMQTTSGVSVDALGGDHNTREFIADIDYSRPIDNGPNALGFDYFYGISASLDMHPYIYIKNDRFVGECTTEKDFTMRKTQPGPAHADFEDIDVLQELAQKTVGYIRAQSDENPFFIYMPLTAPHIPVSPSKPFQGKNELGPYGDFVMEVDDVVGQVINELERKDLLENTLVIFTSDNGAAHYVGAAEMIEQGHYPSYVYRGYKADIFEGGHRVPFIAHWPNRIAAGTTSNETICLTDLLATCAALLNVRLPQNAGEDSYNLVPVLIGPDPKTPIREATVHHSADGSFAIRQGPWKLILAPGSGGWSAPTNSRARDAMLPDHQLYNLSTDIREQRNVINKHPDVANHLSELLEKYKAEGRSVHRR